MEELKHKLHEDALLNRYQVDISYGVAIVNEDIDGIERLTEQADINLYKQKNLKK